MRASLARNAFAAVISALLLAGCGGGRGTVPAAPGGPTQTSSGTKAPLSIRIDMPMTTDSSKHRVPKYVSPATTQAVINIQSGGTSISGYPQTVALTPTSGGCSSTLASTQCMIALSLLPGSYTLSISLEDASNTVLSQAQTVPVNILAGQANVVTLTVGGLAASVQIVPLTTHRMQLSPNAASLYGNVPIQFETLALDADNNVIVGPGAPTATAALTSGAHATLTAPTSTSPNLWTITPNYTATNPTVPTTDTLTVSATPVPASGGSTVSSATALSIYQPWVYVLDASSHNILAFDETGAALAPSGGAFTGGAMTLYPSGLEYAQGSLYVVGGYNHTNGEISAYPLVGGAPTKDVTHATAGFAGLNNPMYPDSIAYDPHNQQLYVGDSAYNAETYSVDAALTAGVQATASGGGLGPYGFAFDPATNQMIGPSPTGGLIICSEALACAPGNNTQANAFGIAYDPTNGLLGVGAPNCCSATGGVFLEDLTGTVQSTIGASSAVGPQALAYDPFADSWFFYRKNTMSIPANGMNEYNAAGALTIDFSTLGNAETVAGIVVVP